MWQAPAAALRCLIVAALTTMTPAANRHPPRTMTMVVISPLPASACPAVRRRARKPATSSVTMTDVRGT